jgi:hypothetical protein
MAMNLARTPEQREQYYAMPSRTSASAFGPPTYKAMERGLLPGTPPTLALPSPPSGPPAASTIFEGRQLKRLSPFEMETRQRLGLCFNCDEKFERSHNQVCKRVFLLELSEDDDAKDINAATDDPLISLLTMAGVRMPETM